MGQHFLEDFLTDLKQDPPRQQRWYTNNMISRVLGYIVAFTEDTKARVLRCTADGKLKVAVSGSGLTRYNTKSGVGADTYTAPNTYDLPEGYSYIDILIEGNDALMSLKPESGVWGDDITLPVGAHEYPFSYIGVRIRNRTAGQNTIYEFVNMR